MLNIIVSFFNISSKFVQTLSSICQQASECPMQRTMLAAVHATDERLIAPRYLMRISAHLVFSSSAQKDDSQWGSTGQVRTVGRVW